MVVKAQPNDWRLPEAGLAFSAILRELSFGKPPLPIIVLGISAPHHVGRESACISCWFLCR